MSCTYSANNANKTSTATVFLVRYYSHSMSLLLSSSSSCVVLMDHGSRTPDDAHVSCAIAGQVCMSATARNNQLGASEQRLSAFRALSNPSYVMLTAADPILAAFRLSERLRQHGDADGALRAEYDALDTMCRAFSVGLVGLCRTSAEVELILRRSDGCAPYGGEFPYSRLLMAVDLKQKEFVSHAYVQQMLESSWTGNWYAWRRYGMMRKCGLAVVRLAQLPWVVIAILALPWTAAGRHYALPVNRMLSYAASYALFLLALALANNLNAAAWPSRYPVGLVLKATVATYSASFAVRTGKLALAQGPYRYFRLLWNAYDCVMLAILAGAAACWWWLTYADPRAAPFVSATDNQPPRERKYLRSTDPVLVAEGLLAVATVMAYLRLLFLCQLNYVLGPMQVSLGKMTVDFVRFTVLFAIIMSAFNVGLCTLYQYYEGMTNTDPVTGFAVTQDESFVSVMATLKTLFWSIFCMTSTTAGRVVIGSTTVAAAEEDDAMAAQHYFTQFVGTGLYAVFVSVAVFIMLNMLVGTMTNTYQRVTDNAYVEWVFGRTQVYLSFSAHAEPPPPFNLIPSFYCFANVFGLFRYCCRNTADAVLSRISSMSSPPAVAHADDEKFRQLMAELGRRYYRRKLSDDNSTKCRPPCGT